MKAESSISIKLHQSFTLDKVYLLINYIWLAEIMESMEIMEIMEIMESMESMESMEGMESM